MRYYLVTHFFCCIKSKSTIKKQVLTFLIVFVFFNVFSPLFGNCFCTVVFKIKASHNCTAYAFLYVVFQINYALAERKTFIFYFLNCCLYCYFIVKKYRLHGIYIYMCNHYVYFDRIHVASSYSVEIVCFA